MSGKRDRGSYSEADLEVEHPKDHAAGPDGGRRVDEAGAGPHGAEANRADPAQAQPGRGFRLHELRVARSGGRPPAPGRVLRERREGGRRGGHQGPGDSRILRRAQHRRPGPAVRALARSAGPDHPSDGQASRRHPLSADRVGRGVRADRPPSCTSLGSPDEAIFYTSGRASNEAAFVYQLFARAFGTNNLPDCSNMCHESTSIALQESIGIGKASVSIEDVYHAKLIILAGQNPGTNHPRMLSALEIAKKNGAKIVSINPLREAGLVRFKNPQEPKGLVGKGTELSDYAPADQAERRSGAVPGRRVAAGAMGRPGPRLHRQVHHRLRAVEGARQPPSIGTWSPRPPG